MNIKDEEQNEQPPEFDPEDFEIFDPRDDEDPLLNALMANIYRLETDLDSEKEERKEERFIWVCVAVVLVNMGFLIAIDGGSVSYLFLLALQLVALLGYAKRLGVDWAVQGIGYLLHKLSGSFEKKDKD